MARPAIKRDCATCPHELRDVRVWDAYASAKSKTHDQVRCPECGLWTRWVPKPSTVFKKKLDDASS